ncbi:hypothetical protein NLJ89_g9365 [Agrocybe chaxingu]|uniref:Uncharacterized protein n=1 Tax=Agrocybe chaxingu TaxID=84603 RepID=A0A9W8JQX8_9AGAR|nr:hypothetical protein NLJ89_g9365 [Agrocybe chaxingu]
MSLRSKPCASPEEREPLYLATAPEIQKKEAHERTGTETMPGSYPTSPTTDTTYSGGYGADPSQVWSNQAQRGVDMPTGNVERGSGRAEEKGALGLIDQSVNGTKLKTEFEDAKQGRDRGFGGEEDEWGIEKGAEKDI